MPCLFVSVLWRLLFVPIGFGASADSYIIAACFSRMSVLQFVMAGPSWRTTTWLIKELQTSLSHENVSVSEGRRNKWVSGNSWTTVSDSLCLSVLSRWKCTCRKMTGSIQLNSDCRTDYVIAGVLLRAKGSAVFECEVVFMSASPESGKQQKPQANNSACSEHAVSTGTVVPYRSNLDTASE